MDFVKYHGAGNDFIMIDDRQELFDTEDSAFIFRLCHRRFGIGADGLILIRNDPEQAFKMVYFNADGKPGSMCGNGGRCAAAFASSLGIFTGKTEFAAYDGIHSAKIHPDQNVTLSLLDVREIRAVDSSAWVIDTGSPHYVCFTRKYYGDAFKAAAQKIRNLPSYKAAGINVNFVWPEDEDHLQIRTFERGVENETYACGTGIVASAIAACEYFGKEAGQHRFTFTAAGGILIVDLERHANGHYHSIYLTGPAQLVYYGQWLNQTNNT